MYSAPTLPIPEQNPLSMKDKHRRSCSVTKFSNYLVNITIKLASKHVKSIRNRFFNHSTIFSSDSWNPFTRAPSVASGLGLCTLHPQSPKRFFPTSVLRIIPLARPERQPAQERSHNAKNPLLNAQLSQPVLLLRSPVQLQVAGIPVGIPSYRNGQPLQLQRTTAG